MRVTGYLPHALAALPGQALLALCTGAIVALVVALVAVSIIFGGNRRPRARPRRQRHSFR